MLHYGEAPFLECSTKGDGRFSALRARLRGYGNQTIEEVYQGAKVFEDGSTNLPWREAKGRPAVNAVEVRALYGTLWNEYFAENPYLYEVVMAHTGFSDVFGRAGGACQAEEIQRIADAARHRLSVLRDAVVRASAPHGACLSGAALGADIAWGRGATAAGMNALHWSFPGQQKERDAQLWDDARDGRRAVLSDATLELAAGPMLRVRDALKRRLPDGGNVRRLLLRNWFQVAWSDSLYAVSTMVDGEVKGGTAWAVEAFRQRKEGSAFVFCQETNAWSASHAGGPWSTISDYHVPPPEGIWAGIGSRDLKTNGLEAIAKLCIRIPCPLAGPCP